MRSLARTQLKLLQKLGAIAQIGKGFPRVMLGTITPPLNQKFGLAGPTKTLLEQLFDLILQLAVQLNGRRRRLDSAVTAIAFK